MGKQASLFASHCDFSMINSARGLLLCYCTWGAHLLNPSLNGCSIVWRGGLVFWGGFFAVLL